MTAKPEQAQSGTDLNLDDLLAEFSEVQVDEVQGLARRALNTLFVLFRLVRMYSLNNDAFRKPLAAMVAIVNAHVESRGSFSLKLQNDSFFVNNAMVRLDSTSLTSADYLLDAFPRVGIGAIGTQQRLTEQELRIFLELLQQAEQTAEEAERVKLIAGKRLGNLAVFAPSGDVDPMLAFKRDAQKTYAVMAVMIDETAREARTGQIGRLTKLKRLVLRVVDLVVENPSIMTALAGNYGGEEHGRYHAINVCILTLVLGRTLGLPRRQLADLGVAALIHDLGQPADVEEGCNVRERPGMPEAVRLLAHSKALNDQTLAWTITSYETNLLTGRVDWHEHGYPVQRKVGMSARIVAVAHWYERLTNAPAERSLSPHFAMQEILQRGGRLFDLALTKAFVRSLGLYPVGTVLELSSHTFVTVIQNSDDPRRVMTPIVRPIEKDASKPALPQKIDLFDAGPGHTIVRVVPPREMKVNVTAEILGQA